MLHELAANALGFIQFLSDTAPADTGGGTSDGFKTAIVVTAGTVISAGFATLAIVVPKHREAPTPQALPTGQGTPAPNPDPGSTSMLGPYDRYERELERQIAKLEKEVADNDKIVSGQAAMIERMRTFCWNNGLDPIRFRKMQQGETRETTIAE